MTLRITRVWVAWITAAAISAGAAGCAVEQPPIGCPVASVGTLPGALPPMSWW